MGSSDIIALLLMVNVPIGIGSNNRSVALEGSARYFYYEQRRRHRGFENHVDNISFLATVEMHHKVSKSR